MSPCVHGLVKRQQVLQYGNPDRHPGPGPGGFFAGPSGEVFRGSKYGSALESVRLKHLEVDQAKLKKAFLHFVKVINENGYHRRNYLENGKNGSLKCVACGRFAIFALYGFLLFVMYCLKLIALRILWFF